MFWGDININIIIPSEPSDVLMNINGSIIPNKECDANDFITGSIADSVICTRVENGQSICHGNSGGPLVIKGDNGGSDMQVGVVLWGIICAADQFPNIQYACPCFASLRLNSK